MYDTFVGLFCAKRCVWLVKRALLNDDLSRSSKSFALNRFILMVRHDRLYVTSGRGRNLRFIAAARPVPLNGGGQLIDTSKRHTVIDLCKVRVVVRLRRKMNFDSLLFSERLAENSLFV